MCFTVVGDSGDAPVRCFFDFFIPLPSKTPTFESISGKLLPGRLWRSGSALGGSGGAQGGPGRPKAASFAFGSEHWAYLIVETTDVCCVEN